MTSNRLSNAIGTWAVVTAVVLVTAGGCGKRIAADEAPGSLVGTVIDSRTGKPVQAVVQIIGTKTGAMCDLQGHFRIARLAPGTYGLRVSGVYYFDAEFTEVVIPAGQTMRLDVALEMKPAEPM